MRQNNHKRSKLQEKRAAKDYGGTITPGSGNQWFQKADVKTDTWLIECKTTTKASYSLKAITWDKLWRQAMSEGRDAMMEIEFSDEDIHLVVLDKNDFLALMEYLP